jgi:hypothetical protein
MGPAAAAGGQAWRENWEYVIPFLAFPPDVRRVVYTTIRSRRSGLAPGRRHDGGWVIPLGQALRPLGL